MPLPHWGLLAEAVRIYCVDVMAATGMEMVKMWVEAHRFGHLLGGLVDTLGVETAEDLHYVTEMDLHSIGAKPVQARRFVQLLAAPGTRSRILPAPPVGAACVPLAPAAQVETAGDPSLDVVEGDVDDEFPADLEDGADEDDAEGRGDSWEVNATDGAGDHGDVDKVAAAPSAKRRKQTRLSFLQRGEMEGARSSGSGRRTLPERYANGTPRVSLEAVSVRGASKTSTIVAGQCRCIPMLRTFDARLVGARRTAREKQYVENGGNKKGTAQEVYNYARLGAAVVELLFDGRGNWVVHEACARRHLNVSNWWLARCHRRALNAAQSPIKKMTKSDMLSSPNLDTLVCRILRPEGCLLSTLQYFRAANGDDEMEVVDNVTEHGLAGMVSNHRKVAERAKFVAFVRAHRSPTGRTADKWGRFHGAAYYLDSKWVVLRSSRNNPLDTRLSFSSSFNAALVAAGLPMVHGDIPLRWLKALFRSTKKIEGTVVPSDEHTTLYPHKTDACATCGFFLADIRQAQMVLKRHRQQNDQASLERRQAIDDARGVILDLKLALDKHKDEAACAIMYHRGCTTGAAKRFEDLAAMFEEVMGNAPMEDQPADLPLTPQEELMCVKCCTEWHDVSSDYQQDKAVPSWNESPQPGPTYFMSGETHYAHIFCDESCGEASGPTRFSRNVVYSRSEAVGGAKSSDDTLSTLCDMLLGGVKIGAEDPPVYRSGCEPGGVTVAGEQWTEEELTAY